MAQQTAFLFQAFSLLALLAVSACAPSGGTVADPQVKGDHSTIQGDSAATMDRRLQ